MNKRISSILFAALMLASCGEHGDYDIVRFTGEYRYYAGIAEFFDCKSRVKYYVDKSGIDKELEQAYIKLGLDEKDDVYMKIKGYLKEEEEQMEGIVPSVVFVPVEILGLDKDRGCERAIRQGN